MRDTVKSEALLPEWCRNPLQYLNQWRESVLTEALGSHANLSPIAEINDLPLEARALLAAHTLEHLPDVCKSMSDEHVAAFLRGLVEDPCMYSASSPRIADETRLRLVSSAPNMVTLLVSRTANELAAGVGSTNPCASLLFMFWDCPVGWRVESFDFLRSRKLMLEQIQSDHLPSIESGLHGIGHLSLEAGKVEPYDWIDKVEKHVLQRTLPKKLKQYAQHALRQEVQ